MRLRPLRLIILLAVAMSAASVARAGEPVRVQLHWLHQFEFAAFYMAKAKGFYADAGLDVSLATSEEAGGDDVVDVVLRGDADYGVGYSSLLHDYHTGRPVVALGALLQDSPLVLMTMEGGEIDTPADLRGRRVMISGDALQATPLMALLFRYGVFQSDIILTPHSHDVGDLISGDVAASSAFVSNEPFVMRERGAKPRIFDPRSVGLSFYENILFTSQDVAAAHPERTAAFVQGTLRGWRYALDHPDEAIDVILHDYGLQGKSRAALGYEAEALSELAESDATPLGAIDVAKLIRMSDAYRLMGVEMSAESIDGFLWRGAERIAPESSLFTAAERAFIENTVIRAATTTNWRPFSFIDRDSGEPLGIGHDFWRRVVEVAGLRQDVTAFTSFPEELQALRDKTQDVIYSVGETEDRKAYALFTEPYARFPLAIATSKDENFIPDVSAVAGETIAVGDGFTAHKMMLAAYPALDYLPVKTAKDGLDAVSNGDAFAFVDIMPVLSHSIAKHGFTNLKISGDLDLTFDLRIMVRDDYPELVSIANKVITNIPQRDREEILNRWTNVQYEQIFDYKRLAPYIALTAIIIISVYLWLLHAKRSAQRANRAKSEFLALMSHDLRTPLNAIMGFSDIIKNQTFGPLGDRRYAEYAKDIHASGELLVNLINDILDLSKIEAGKYQLAEEEIDIRALIDASIRQCSVLSLGSSVKVTSRAPDNLAKLNGDRRVLIQILNNLISNAVKFSHEGGEVDVLAGMGGGGGLEIAIVDHGVGMTAQELKRVLEPFEQADSGGARRYQGTGLGLYVSRRLMHLLGGELSLTSAEGRGTTATLRFPAARTLTLAA